MLIADSTLRIPITHGVEVMRTPKVYSGQEMLPFTKGLLGRELLPGKVIVWGEAMVDLFPDGRAELGGPSANVAFHLARLGVPVSLAARVGNDALGRLVHDRLQAGGVDLSLLQVDNERGTGTVTVEFPDGDSYAPQYRTSDDAAWERIAMTPALETSLSDASIVVYGTTALATEAGTQCFDSMLDLLPPGVLRVCDPNLRPGYDGPRNDQALLTALRVSDLVKFSREDAALLQDRLGVADAVSALAAAGPRFPSERPVRLLVVTDEAGSQFVAGKINFEVNAVEAEPGGNGVGCGDAYNAAMLAGILEGWNYRQVGRFASHYAGLVASAPGATPAVSSDHIEAARTAAALYR
jgi:fructokinase